MAKIVALCGKLCAGKTTLAQKLRNELPAVILNSDELTLALPFDHDATYPAVKEFLWRKAVEIARAGTNVVLDFGFWSRADRDEITAMAQAAGVSLQWQYVSVTDEEWRRNIASRNEKVLSGEDKSYFADEGLIRKCLELFEEPLPGELNDIP